jgi:hypothetical protein
MITVRTPVQYFQEKIDLGRSLQGKALALACLGGLFHKLWARRSNSLAR